MFTKCAEKILMRYSGISPDIPNWLIFIILLPFFIPSSVLAQSTIDPGYFYRLTNDYTGRGVSLEATSKRAALGRTADVRKQYWKLTQLPGGRYQLTNLRVGKNLSLSRRNPSLIMAPAAGGDLAQSWSLIPLGNGKYRLINTSRGAGKSLDVTRNKKNLALGNTGNYSGQIWTLSRLGKLSDIAALPGSDGSSASLLQQPPKSPDNITIEVQKEQTINIPGINTTRQDNLSLNKAATPDLSGTLKLSNTQQQGSDVNLQIGGRIQCLNNPTAPGCQSEPGMTTAASRGADVFPEPGLGAFLVNGGAAALERIYDDPVFLARQIWEKRRKYTPPPQIIADPGVRKDFQTICKEPIGNNNPLINSLMFMALVDAILTPVNKRSLDQRNFVDAFAGYVQRRRLFVAERAQWIYDKWKRDQQLRTAQSSLQRVFNLQSDLPDEVVNQVSGLLTLFALKGAVQTTLISVITEAPVFQSLFPYAGRAFSTGAMGLSKATGVLGRAAALSGPASIAALAIVGSTVATIKVVKAAEFEAALKQSLDSARKPGAMEKFVQNEEALAQLAALWQQATLQTSGAVIFRSNGNRTGFCDALKPVPSQVPAAVKGRFVLANTVNVFQMVPGPKKSVMKSASFSAVETLNASGLSPNLRPTRLGESVWKAYAIAQVNCLTPYSIEKYLKTGVTSCNTGSVSAPKGAGVVTNPFLDVKP